MEIPPLVCRPYDINIHQLIGATHPARGGAIHLVVYRGVGWGRHGGPGKAIRATGRASPTPGRPRPAGPLVTAICTGLG